MPHVDINYCGQWNAKIFEMKAFQSNHIYLSIAKGNQTSKHKLTPSKNFASADYLNKIHRFQNITYYRVKARKAICYFKRKKWSNKYRAKHKVHTNNRGATYRWVSGGFFQFCHCGLKCSNEIMWPIVVIIITLYL